MAMTINTNVMSLNAQRNLASNASSLATSMQRLSSGMRVNSAKDDAAGLAIAERMSAQVRGANVAVRNANDAISLFQTAEGAMGRITENLQRIRELAVQSANGTLDDTKDRTGLQAEVTELAAEITRIGTATKFNGVALLSGTFSGATFQVGADSTDVITTTNSFNMTGLGALTASIGTQAGATSAIAAIDTDLNTVNTARAQAGAAQSRFEAVVTQLQVYSENTSAARGRIMDADFAQETANLSRAQVLQQAGSAMVAAANQSPQQVMALLRNF